MPQPHELVPAIGDNQIARSNVMVARSKYDFAVDGGAVGDINLGISLPSGALVLAAFVNVTTVLTSGGAATVALKSEAAGDLQSAAAISGAPWSTTGWKAGTKTYATAPVKLTADRNIAATVATAALTAGVFEVLVFYLPPGF